MRLKVTSITAALSSTVIAAGMLTIPAASPASAAYVTRSVHGHHGRFGHGCRTVRTVIHHRFGRNRVIFRRRCH